MERNIPELLNNDKKLIIEKSHSPIVTAGRRAEQSFS